MIFTTEYAFVVNTQRRRAATVDVWLSVQWRSRLPLCFDLLLHCYINTQLHHCCLWRIVCLLGLQSFLVSCLQQRAWCTTRTRFYCRCSTNVGARNLKEYCGGVFLSLQWLCERLSNVWDGYFLKMGYSHVCQTVQESRNATWASACPISLKNAVWSNAARGRPWRRSGDEPCCW